MRWVQLCESLSTLWDCLSLGLEWNWPFPVLWPLLSFPNFWHIECSTFIASSFRIWNSSTGIPSPPIALFSVMLPKAHMTSHSRMSGSRWVITSSWLSGSWRSFLSSSSVYSCHLFLISSTSVRSITFLSFIVPSLHEMFPWYLSISWRDFESFLFCCFPLFLCTDHWGRLSYLSWLFFGTLHSNGYIFPFLLCFTLLFFSQYLQGLLRQPFCFFAFLFLGDDLDPCFLYNVMNLCP